MTSAATLWQHPFVDVFKYVKLGEWKFAEKRGDASMVQDKLIGKPVLRLRGSVPAANSVRFPTVSDAEGGPRGGSLGLTGRYIYLQLRAEEGQSAVFHVDVAVGDRSVHRFSFGTMHKAVKEEGAHVSMPLSVAAEAGTWTTVGIDVDALLRAYAPQARERSTARWTIRGFELCANAKYRNVLTSDNVYNRDNAPQPLQLSRAKSDTSVAWKWVPRMPPANEAVVSGSPSRLSSPRPARPAAAVYSSSPGPEETLSETTRLSSPAPPPAGRSSAGGASPSTPGEAQPQREPQPSASREGMEQRLRASRARVEAEADSLMTGAGMAPPARASASASASAPERGHGCGRADEVPATSGAGPAPVQDPSRTYGRGIGYQSKRRLGSSPGDAAAASVLQPEPIAELAGLVGFSGDVAGTALWSSDGDHAVFPCASVIVVMRRRPILPADADNAPREPSNPPTDTEWAQSLVPRQRFLFGHTGPVTALVFSRDSTVLASAQGGRTPSVRLWDFRSGRCMALLSAHAESVSTISFSLDDRLLVAVGLDARRRQQLVVWDVGGIYGRGGGASRSRPAHEIIARQVSEFDIQAIEFSPHNPEQLVSAGRENIRFWRIRRGHLPGCPVVLNEFSRGCEYTCLAFEAVANGSSAAHGSGADPRVFVASTAGTVAQVNYRTRELECVFRLHDGPIRCLAINEGFCVTGADDACLRVWPLDFSDFFLEAKHEGAVTSAAVSWNGLSLLVGTRAGTLGELDVASHGYQTLLRSHTGAVHAIAVRPEQQPPRHGEQPAHEASAASAPACEVATVSADGTIRVWDAANLRQLYEFDAPRDKALSVIYHPTRHILCCGFASGAVRVFDVPSASMLHEYRQHRAPVRSLAYSADGSVLFSADGGGHVCIYDTSSGYQPVRMLAADGGGGGGDGGVGEPSPCGVHCAEDKLVVLAGGGESLVLFHTASLRPLHKLAAPKARDGRVSPFVAARLAQGGTEVVATNAAGRVLRYSTATGTLLRSAGTAGTAPTSRGGAATASPALAVSPGGVFLATGDSECVLTLRDYFMRGPSPPATQAFIGHLAPITDLAFSNDGKRIISCDAGVGLLVWSFLGDDDGDAATAVAVSQAEDHARRHREQQQQQQQQQQLQGQALSTRAPTEHSTDSHGPTIDTGSAAIRTSASGEAGATGGSGSESEHDTSAKADALPRAVEDGTVPACAPSDAPAHPTPSEQQRALDENRQLLRQRVAQHGPLAGVRELVPGSYGEDGAPTVAGSVRSKARPPAPASAPAPATRATPGVPATPLPSHGRRASEPERDEDKDEDEEGEVGLQRGASLHADTLLGFSACARDNVVWRPGSSLLAYTAGKLVVIEHLASRHRRLLRAHDAAVHTLSLSPQGGVLATVAVLDNDPLRLEVALWAVAEGGRAVERSVALLVGDRPDAAGDGAKERVSLAVARLARGQGVRAGERHGAGGDEDEETDDHWECSGVQRAASVLCDEANEPVVCVTREGTIAFLSEESFPSSASHSAVGATPPATPPLSLSLSFSPDGKRLALVTPSSVVVWDVRSRARLAAATRAGRSAAAAPPVTAAAWLSDSVLAASVGGQLTWWHVDDAACELVAEPVPAPLGAGGDGEPIARHDEGAPLTGGDVPAITAAAAVPPQHAISPAVRAMGRDSGGRLRSGGSAGRGKHRRTKRRAQRGGGRGGHVQRRLAAHATSSGLAPLLAVGDSEGCVWLIGADTFAPLARWRAFVGDLRAGAGVAVTSLCWRDRTLVAASVSGEVRRWPRADSFVARWATHAGSDAPGTDASADAGGGGRAWLAAPLEPLAFSRAHAEDDCDRDRMLGASLRSDGPVTAAAWDGEAAEGVVATATGTVWYVNWSAEPPSLVQLSTAPQGRVPSLALAAAYRPSDTASLPASDGEGAGVAGAAGGGDRGREAAQPPCSTEESEGEDAWPPHGRLVSASDDGSVRVWDVVSGHQVMAFSVPGARCALVAAVATVEDPAFAPGQDMPPLPPLVAAAFSDGRVRLLDVARRRLVVTVDPLEASRVAEREGDSDAEDRGMEGVEAAVGVGGSGDEEWTTGRSAITSLAFVAAGRVLAIGSDAGAVVLIPLQPVLEAMPVAGEELVKEEAAVEEASRADDAVHAAIVTCVRATRTLQDDFDDIYHPGYAVTCIDCSPLDPTLLAVTSSNGMLSVWRVVSGDCPDPSRVRRSRDSTGGASAISEFAGIGGGGSSTFGGGSIGLRSAAASTVTGTLRKSAAPPSPTHIACINLDAMSVARPQAVPVLDGGQEVGDDGRGAGTGARGGVDGAVPCFVRFSPVDKGSVFVAVGPPDSCTSGGAVIEYSFEARGMRQLLPLVSPATSLAVCPAGPALGGNMATVLALGVGGRGAMVVLDAASGRALGFVGAGVIDTEHAVRGLAAAGPAPDGDGTVCVYAGADRSIVAWRLHP